MFQRNYLAVYTLVMFADWLQGSYIYPLYREYGYSLNEISYLFVAGFLSSAVFGTFVGAVADHWGRKKLAIAFCFIYMISCFTKLSPNYTVLIFGRVLAGIATSLLTSVFESWMVCEHFARNYDSAWLQTTFAMATFMNGVSAIGSGVIANFLVRPFGNVSPFILAAFTLLAPAIIMLRSWNENYGSHPQLSGDSKPSFWAVVLMIFSDRKIFAVGTIQFTFEAAMFCWIFLWSPVLEKAENTSNLPFGIIFATFMLAIMTGSMLYEILLAKGWSYGGILRMACALAAASFTVCIILPINDYPSVYNFFFILFEFAVGLYYPSLSTIRSSILPEKVRSTLLNIFRVPLNILVVLALINVDQIQQPFMFFGFAVLCIIATFMTKEVVMFGRNNGKSTTSNPDV
ncbi:hypothetical protein BKA69DRAFT_1135560 [Paraphysoderma sedebokerense]|nr:hypothetical protein BKA69DRAFT_1135560 [Paraphysoderma sedebokerense]